MAFPSITPLKVTTFRQKPNTITKYTADGFPYVVQLFTGRKHDIEAQYLLSTADWDLLFADFKENHSTQFTWADARDAVPDVLTVSYAGQPTRSRVGDGITTPGNYFVVVRLVQV